MKTDLLNRPDDLEQKLIGLIGQNILHLSDDFDRESDLARAGLDSMALMQLLILQILHL